MYKMLKSIRWVAVFLCLFLINMTVAGGYFEGKYQTSRYNRRYDYNQKPQKMQEPGGIRGITRTSSDLLEEKLRHILEIMDRGEKEGYSAADKKRLTELKDELGNLNRQIVDEFQKVEVSLIEKSVNREIVDRHREFVQEYQKNFDLLMQAIAEIPEQSVFSIRSNNTRRTGKIIKKIKNEWLPKEFNPFETNDFPQKNIKLDPGEPRLYPSFTPAYEYTQNSFFAASFDNYRVVSQDLQETVEVKLTPEIRELAAELDNNPVKIYEFVRNNFDYEPYYGSVKGAQETLWQKAGNDFDLASLLIALYRAAGIPARYVYGVVEIPLEQVKRWVGIEDSKTVVNMFATNGIPSKGIIKGGEITHLLKEHVWVEAYVPLNDYRGCRVDEHGKGWIPLDPSFKQYTETPGFDFSTEVPFDIEGFITELKNAANISDGGFSFSGIDEELIQSRLEEYQKELELYVDENGSFQHPEEIFGSRRIVPEKHSILPVSLPYKVSNVLQELASLNDNHRQKLTLRVEDPYFWESSSCVYTASIPELAGKTVSLAYVAATQADEDFLASYLPEPPEDGEPIDPKKLPSSLPAYLIRVKPQIIIDGQAVATGSAVTMGTKQDFYMHFAYPAPVKIPCKEFITRLPLVQPM